MQPIDISDPTFDLRYHATDGVIDREYLAAERRRLRGMLDTTYYDRADLAWHAATDIGYFGFVYDRRVYDPLRGDYPIEELVDRLRDTYGVLDSMMIWSGYPRLGIDPRTQFDLYRLLPGGLAGLRRVADRLHRCGVRVFLPYLPWNAGESADSYASAAQVVEELDADGLMLDTMRTAAPLLRQAVDAVRSGVVLIPEHIPLDWQSASLCTGSTLPHNRRPNQLPPTWWDCVWQDHADISLDVLTLRWLEPRYTMFGNLGHYPIHDYQCPYVAADFFHGIGHQVIENLFGRSVSFSPEAARILRRAVALRRRYRSAFLDPDWQPYLPTLQTGLLCHQWRGDGFTLYTLYNPQVAAVSGDLLRVAAGDRAQAHDAWHGRAATATRTGGDLVLQGTVHAQRCGCFVVADAPGTVELSTPDRSRDRQPLAANDLRALPPSPVTPTRRYADSERPPGMLPVPAARYLFRIEGTHAVPEGGSYSYPDRGEICARQVEVAALYVDRTEVTNSAYLDFVQATHYRPADLSSLLAHWERGSHEQHDAEPWTWRIPAGRGDHPVVNVSIDDARAYARWAGKRLPTEEEWQFAAQGEQELRWPWGFAYAAERCNGCDGTLGRNQDIEACDGQTTPVDRYPNGASPFGVLDMSGNVWEWTESVRDTGHVRYAILKGGCYFRAGGSRWFQPGGALPATRHARMILLHPGVDRSPTVGFRCVADVADITDITEKEHSHA